LLLHLDTGAEEGARPQRSGDRSNGEDVGEDAMPENTDIEAGVMGEEAEPEEALLQLALGGDVGDGAR